MDNFEILNQVISECESNQTCEIKKKDENFGKIDENNRTKQECKHSIKIDGGVRVCELCGFEFEREIDNSKEWRYYGAADTRHNGDPSRCHMRKPVERTINKDVENMNFSDKIIEKASQIYDSVSGGKIYRGNSRKAIIFACIFHAYKLDKNPQSCENLIEIFSLDRKIALRGLKAVNLKTEKTSELKSTYITPEHLITDIMLKFHATQAQIDEVIAIYNQIHNKSSILNRSRPQSVAAGIVRYYIIINHKDISMTDFRAKVKLSELTINRIVKEITNLLQK